MNKTGSALRIDNEFIHLERRDFMKKGFGILMAGLAIAFTLTMAGVGTAQDTARSVVISRDSKLGDQALSKGNYQVRFTEGKDGEIVFLKGKREVLKASYELSKLNSPAPDTSVIFTRADDGTFQIKRIEFKGMETALVLR